MGTDKPLVSLIVPIYRAQDTLRECVDSLLSQSYKKIEMILVDDGSPDDCGKICDEYAAKDNRVRVLHQKNRGVSAARNTGVSASQGMYIVFIDADDQAEHELVEYMLSILLETDSDIAVCGCETPARWGAEQTQEFTGEEALCEMLRQRLFDTGPWSKLFKAELIKHCPFPDNMFFEDLAVMCKIIGSAKKVIYSSRKIYNYRKSPGGTMNGGHVERLLDEITAADMMYSYVTETFPHLAKEAASRRFSAYCQVLLKLPDHGYEKERKLLWTSIKRDRWQILTAHRVRCKNRGAALASFFGEREMRRLWRAVN